MRDGILEKITNPQAQVNHNKRTRMVHSLFSVFFKFKSKTKKLIRPKVPLVNDENKAMREWYEFSYHTLNVWDFVKTWVANKWIGSSAYHWLSPVRFCQARSNSLS